MMCSVGIKPYPQRTGWIDCSLERRYCWINRRRWSPECQSICFSLTEGSILWSRWFTLFWYIMFGTNPRIRKFYFWLLLCTVYVATSLSFCLKFKQSMPLPFLSLSSAARYGISFLWSVNMGWLDPLWFCKILRRPHVWGP